MEQRLKATPEENLIESSVASLVDKTGRSKSQIYNIRKAVQGGQAIPTHSAVGRQLLAVLADGPINEADTDPVTTKVRNELDEKALKAKEDRLLTTSKRLLADIELSHRRGELVEFALVQRVAVALGHAIRSGLESGRRTIEIACPRECRAEVVEAFDDAGAVILQLAREQISKLENVGQSD